MKRLRHFWLAQFILLTVCVRFTLGDEPRFVRLPDVRGNKIVFTYEGDLWLTTTDGGNATRITNYPGNEQAAKFSPDGNQIAFTAAYDGETSVYLMPTTGGIPTRLTYMPMNNGQTLCWTPDGSRIVFRSSFERTASRDPNLYFVDTKGSLPERFPLDRGVLCSFSSDGKAMVYCRRGIEDYYWKRYKGGQYQDIWMYNFTTRTFTPISDYVGKNSYPMWIGNKMYFVSDRTNGIANLYAQDLTTKQVSPITSYADFDVMMPSTDGTNIVFVYNGYLSLHNVAAGTTKKLAITLPSDRWRIRSRFIDAKDYIHSLDIANDGKTIVLEARGDVFSTAVEKSKPVNFSKTPGTREMHPRLSPDGKWIAFFSDKSGEYQLYLQPADGGDWVQLTTTLDRTSYQIVWSPDSKKILFGNKDYAVLIVDIASKTLTKVDESNQMKNDEFTWEISDYAWSPDSKWITYTLVQFNRNSQVFLYSLETKKRTVITDDFFDNLNPRFDANGKFLYYLSSRNFAIQMDFYEDNHVVAAPQQVMTVALKDNEVPPFADPVLNTKKGKDSSGFRIDLEGIQKRTYPLPVPAGNYFHLRAGKGKVLWCSVEKFTEDEYEEIFKPNGATKWKVHIFDMEQKKEVTFTDEIREFSLSANGEQMITRRESDIYTGSVDEAFKSKTPGTKCSLGSLTYFADYKQEWNQIFNDTWRWYRDFFYDPGMHGRDWKAMGDAYRAFIPALSSRNELNWMLSQMVGELCVSHTYISGGDMGPQYTPPSPVFTGWLGADLTPDSKAGYYRFDKIYGPVEYNLSLTAPLARPDIDVKEGYFLIAVNGEEVRPPQDYHRKLVVSSGQKVSVTVNSAPSREGAKTYDVAPVRYDQSLRYFRWLADNINYVSKTSGGKVGYMHINAMGSGGIGEFDKFWRAFRYKDGIIIDVRRNSGGWTEYFMIDKLERKMTAYNVLKNMVPFRYPGTASSAHYVAISNEDNGSDGEAFIEHFKARKLGTVVGVPSWGGLVGILNGQTTIDNGTVQQSNNAFWGSEGKWLVENHGADPDILIDNDPASVVAGKDPQLDKALEVVMKKIKDDPFSFPARPAYPKK
jgi:tricorn protease